MRRTWRTAAVVLSSVLLLAGCATLPTSSPVQTAPPQVEQDDPGFFYQPNPPAENASPENIVRSFIQAASAGGGYDVAKEFLTAEAAADWNPDAGVIVHTASWTTTPLGTNRIRLRVPTSAQVNASGLYTPSGQTVTRDFQLTQVRGQWRISECPDGVVLAQPAFLRVFKSASLQFFDAGYKRFVPDLRWFPTRADRSADIVRALLAGQAPTLTSVTRTAFPSEAELRTPVRSSAGQLFIDVATPGAQPDEQATDRMQQQVAESIVRPVATIRLTVNGRPAPTAPQAEPEQLSVAGPVVVAGGRFGTFTAQGSVQEVSALGPVVVKLKPRAVTFSARQNLAAVLTGGGQIAVVDRQRSRLVDTRPGLLAPTLDQQGWTYSIPADDPAGLRVADAAGRSTLVGADLGGTAVRSIEVSTDGTRLLVLLDTSSGPEAYVAGIDRDADGRPVGLTSNRFPVGLDVGGALDATWVDQSSVAVLTTAAAVQNVVVQQLGGTASTLGSLRNAREIVGASSQEDLRAFVGTGAVLEREANDWMQEIPATSGVSVLAVQR